MLSLRRAGRPERATVDRRDDRVPVVPEHDAAAVALSQEFGLHVDPSTAPIFPGVNILNVTAPGISKGNGVEWAARRAGIPVVGVSFGYTDTPIAELKPDRLIDHMRDLPKAVESLLKSGM